MKIKQDNIAAIVVNVPKPSSAFSSIGKVKIDNEELPMVAFNNLDAAIKAKFFKLEKGQSIMIQGRLDPHAKMGKRVIANDVHDAESYKPAKELTAEEAMSMPDPNLKPLNERTMEVKKYSLPDGKFFWSDGLDWWVEKNGPRKRLTRALVKAYNSQVTSQHWFLPDWYSLDLESPDHKLEQVSLDDFSSF